MVLADPTACLMIAPCSRARHDDQTAGLSQAPVRRANLWTSIASLAITGVLILATPAAAVAAEKKLKLSDVPAPAGAASLKPVFTAAAENYIRWCQGCHGGNGRGAPPAVPDLVDQVGYFTRLTEGRAYLIRVPGVALAPISDAELAAVLNFVLQTFSPEQLPPDFRPFTADEVARFRPQRMLAVRRERETLVAKLRDSGLMP
jgi:mono/diheme cytochrome c family protein